MNIELVANEIDKGELVVLLTDTVYGIVGDATNLEVIHKVYNVKRRDYSKPLILMVSSIDMLLRYVDDINDLERKLIDKYWPGKLTILFKKNDRRFNSF